MLHSVSALFTGSMAATSWRMVFDLGMMGVASSLFIVPLNSMIQARSDDDTRSRVIAANNVFNSLFMVASAIITMLFFKAGLTTLDIIFITALMNAAVCLYLFTLLPEFVMRFVDWLLASTIYSLSYEGRDRLPRHGAAVIVCNHVSFIDWFIVTAACRRPVRYVMDHRIFKMPFIGWIFKAAKAIPIAPAKEDPARKEEAFKKISEALRDDNIVCIFPEGMITFDGKLNPFKPGVERILATDPVPVYPMAMLGLWGSFFSRKRGRAMSGVPHPSHRKILVKVGEALSPTTKASEMEKIIGKMLDEQTLEANRHIAQV
jgi:1-acyl-sn-glycerol-3-phosphate acyltransferase